MVGVLFIHKIIFALAQMPERGEEHEYL